MFAVVGAVQGWRKKQPVLMTACLVFIPAWLLGVGYANGITQTVVLWLARAMPGFKGLRETEKLIGVVAFAYAVLIAEGGEWLARFVRESFEGRKIAVGLTAGVLALFIFLGVHSMPLAFGGQVVSTDYPASWYQARTAMALEAKADAKVAPRMLVLPWQAYLDLSFAGDHRVANPASLFFGDAAIVSADTGNINLKSQAPEQAVWDRYSFVVVQDLMGVDKSIDFLKANNVRHIVLIKESDWQRYAPVLDASKKLRKLIDTPSIAVYCTD
jgi:hypothetical protein